MIQQLASTITTDERNMRRNRRFVPYSLSQTDRNTRNKIYEKQDNLMEKLDSISFGIEQALKI